MKNLRTRFISMALVLAALAWPAWGQGRSTPSAETRLAERLAGSALTILRIRPVTPVALQTAALIMDAATELAPDEVELWQLALDIADLAEHEALQDEAVRAIVRLDPTDEVARLRRLMQLVDDAQTVEQRSAVYERLLDPSRTEEIGRPVASRLALDYALLLRREGRVAAFSEQLARSVELDPSNRAAAALATGFYQNNVNDPYGETELLINLFLADPTTLDVQAAIAQLALGSGAYPGAVRMYALLSQCYGVKGLTVPTDLVADRVIALWGAGRVDLALDLIEERQQLFNAMAQGRVLQESEDKTPIDVADVTGLMSPTLATVRAAVLTRQQDPLASESVELALRAYDNAMNRARSAEPPPPAEAFAAAYLEMAWVAVWLSEDMEHAESLVQQAEALMPIDADARARFDGWLALRRGELDEAMRQFALTRTGDMPATVGKALVHLERGQKADAARLLLEVVRTQPGSALGVWSSSLLFDILGRRAPISDTARQIDALISSLPSYLDRFPANPGELLSLRIAADGQTVGPFDPIMVNLEITNTSRLPLAIDAAGPIRPEVALLPTVRVAQQSKLPQMEPIIIDIDRRLRLGPKERVVIPIDLRRYSVGAMMENFLLLGSFVRVKAIWNFRFSEAKTIEPDLLGGETDTLNLRVDGVRVTMGWIEQSMTDIEVMDRPEDIDTLIMLTHLPNYQIPDLPLDQLRPIVERMPTALADAYNRLDPLRQALVLSEMSPGPITEKIQESARASDDRLVQAAYLLNVVRGANDPILRASLQSDDPLVRSMAEQLQALASRSQGAARQPQGGP